MLCQVFISIACLAGWTGDPPQAAVSLAGWTADPPQAAVSLAGAPETIFSAVRDACDGDDVPDAPVRAFRDWQGGVVAFGLHYVNRALRGPDLGNLKIDCRIVLNSGGSGDPASYDDKSWITATWTSDGRRIDALVHHEFQANQHPGRCAFKEYLACWFNSVVATISFDGGESFFKAPSPVVASAPFKQDFNQGRHRGFFNPSNIVSEGPYKYFMTATTGWAGQASGACLFRTRDPSDPQSWQAFDGTGFHARFPDPYRTLMLPGETCRPLPPFPAPVGAIVRHRGSGFWIAVFQAAADGEKFPQPGFYVATSRDLIDWSAPRLLLAGKTLYDDPCGSSGKLISYPSILDRSATTRNFEDVGGSAELYYTTIVVKGCEVTSDRDLVRRRITISTLH